jgi:hypothetical protein
VNHAIGTLRLTGAAADTPALRLRAARELAGADLSPPGLPPAAVLVVRRLTDPLPRRLAGREPRLRPDAAWERAVRERLAAALRSAARPDPHGVVPAEAPALVFADEAELLACVVRLRVHGDLAALWWWRAVRRRLPPAATAGPESGRDPSPLLAACPREAPAALARLARWGEAAVVAAALTPASARRVLAALAVEHGLPSGLAPSHEDEFAAPSGTGESIAPPTDAVPPEPWRDWLPAEILATRIAPEIRCLFGVACGLAAAPHRLRSADVIEKARRSWLPLSPFTRPPSTGSGEPANGSGAPSAAGGETSTAGGEASAAGGEASTPGGGTSTPGGGTSTPGGGTSAAGGEASAAGGETSTGGGETSAAGGGTPAGSGGRRAGSGGPTAERERLAPRLGAGATATLEPRPAPPAVSSEVTQRKTPAWGEEGIATRIGGVLYLIHALLDLGLPEAFETDWRLASTAGPWGTLDLLGRGLLGARFAEVAEDPLWAVLAELAGWPSSAGVREGSLRTAWRVPAGWPAKLADPCDDFAWSAAAGRLRVWSAAGYLVADVRRGPDKPSRQARRELARLAGRRAAAARLARAPAADAPLALPLPPLPPGCPPHLGRWLAAALPAVRRRLLLALAGRRAAPGRRDPVARALAVRGRLYLTSSHVDLVLPLAAAELAARRAGLDRDPGWLPAFGRVVSFHFA